VTDRCAIIKFNIIPPGPKPTPESDLIIDGVVEIVDRTAGTITMWIRGVGNNDDTLTVPIDPIMPGWLLDIEGVGFSTTISRETLINQDWWNGVVTDVVWGEFYAMPFACLSEEQLLELLDETLGEKNV